MKAVRNGQHPVRADIIYEILFSPTSTEVIAPGNSVDTLDQEKAAISQRKAQSQQVGIFLGIVKRFRLFIVGEPYHNDTAKRRPAFLRNVFTAADNEFPAKLRDNRGCPCNVLLIRFRILDVDFPD